MTCGDARISFNGNLEGFPSVRAFLHVHTFIDFVLAETGYTSPIKSGLKRKAMGIPVYHEVPRTADRKSGYSELQSFRLNKNLGHRHARPRSPTVDAQNP